MVATLIHGRESLYRAASDHAAFVDVPAMNFLMVDGRGDPNTSVEYREAIEALFSLSYTLKFALKRENGLEYRVGPPETLWWADDMVEFSAGRKDDWRWTMMIAQPDDVTPERFAQARAEVGRKKHLAALPRVRFERFREGRSAQILHVGPYSAEGPTIARLHAFIAEQGETFDGQREKHHEIYLGDPRRAAPEKLTTIIRQPVASPTAV